jgi:type II secretory pathway component PulF
MSQVKQAGYVRIHELNKQREIEEQNAQTTKNGFKFSGADSLGVNLKGYVPYQTAQEARLRLIKAGVKVESISPKKTLRGKKNKKPSNVEMARLAEQLGEQMEIGMSPSEICELLARNSPNLMLEKALLNAAKLIGEGIYIHDALEAQKTDKGESIFPETFIYALRIGQDVGALNDPESNKSVGAANLMLKFFAQTMKKAHAFRRKIRSALFYPVCVFFACAIAFLIEVYGIIPMMKPLFEGLLQGKDDSLPFLTQWMLNAGDFMSSGIGIVTLIAFIGGIIGGGYYLFKVPAGIDFRERMALRLPVFGKFYLDYNASQACRNLAMLWEGEQDVKKRFETARDTATNPEYKEMFDNILNILSLQSIDLPEAFVPYARLLGEEFASVTETIQRTGNGQQQLYSHAMILEQRAEEKLENTIAVLQQISIAIPAAFVIIILLASYLPIFQLVGKLAGK